MHSYIKHYTTFILFQMYFWGAPLLTKGAFARFFGNHALTSVLSKKAPQLTPVHPFAISISLVFQILFILFKKKQMSVIHAAGLYARRSTYAYQTLLKETMLSGLHNTYTIISILVFTGSIGAWMIMHYGVILANSNLEPSQQDITLPGSIVALACLLFGMNILQFQKNPALR